KLIDQEASRTLKLHLAGRKIVDFQGPHGWGLAAVNTGRLEMLEGGAPPEVAMGLREVQPLVEVRVPIKLSIMELDKVARGAKSPDLAPVISAAARTARVEDTAIFGGLPRGRIKGMLESSPHAPIKLGDIGELPRVIVDAKEVLRRAGVSGPYVLVLGASLHDQ